MDLGTFVDVIDHVDVMRIALRDYFCGFTKAGGEIACLQIMSNDAGAIRLDKFLRVGLAGSKLQTTGREFCLRESIGAFDLKELTISRGPSTTWKATVRLPSFLLTDDVTWALLNPSDW